MFLLSKRLFSVGVPSEDWVWMKLTCLRKVVLPVSPAPIISSLVTLSRSLACSRSEWSISRDLFDRTSSSGSCEVLDAQPIFVKDNTLFFFLVYCSRVFFLLINRKFVGRVQDLPDAAAHREKWLRNFGE